MLPLGLAAQSYTARLYGQDDGLDNQSIVQLAQDAAGHLWIATENGLFRYDGARFLDFAHDHGLTDPRMYNLHIDRTQTIWVASRAGLFYLDGDRFRDYDYLDDQLFGVQINLPNFMNQQHEVQNRADAINFVKRLRAFTPAFAQILEQLNLRESKGLIPPEFMVTEVRKQVSDFTQKPVREHTLYTTFAGKLD